MSILGTTTGKLPVIALVGRPNVGKSRTFNRLVGRREAIVEDTPGVTRDRNYGRFEWYGRLFTLIDTGGFEPEAQDVILEQMKEQAQVAVEEADVIIFVVDGRTGRMGSDETIAQILRVTDKPVFVAVNKLDTPEQASQAAEFYSLGLPEVFPVSAEHGTGFDDLMDAIAADFPRVSEEVLEAPEPDAIRVAVVGKPNAGKSTLINKLLGAERLLTSEIPGTTRDSIDNLVEREGGGRYILVDTAGVRKKRAISLRLEKFSVIKAIGSIESADVVLLVIDALEGATDQDARIAQLAVDRGKALAILLNKWDSVTEKVTQTPVHHTQAVRDQMTFCDFAPVITLSALTGQRVHKIYDLIDQVYGSASQRVATPELNRVMEEIVARHPPPSANRHVTRFYYFNQVGVRPPSFVCQCNAPKAITTSYRRFLVNQIRATYGFEGTPIKVLIRQPSGRHKWNER